MRISSLTRNLAVAAAVCAAAAVVTTPAHAAPAPCPSTDRTGPGAAAAPFTVWMAGDSTMAKPNSGVSCPAGWGSQFDRLFNDDVTVVNNAVGGRSIQTWLYESNVKSTKDSAGECVVSPLTYASRWANMLSSTNGMKAGDWLIIQFGINDGDRNCPRHVGTTRYRQLLSTMAREAKARGVKPVFVTPVAAIRCSGSTAVGNRGFVPGTIAQAQADQVPVIDLHQRSVALYNSLRLCPNNGDYTQGAVGAFFCNDHTHFEAAGAARIAEVVAAALREQGIGLASSLR
ncbi:GDSL-type esterase/lipase family protein [Saccharothrix sp. Mg75]|uniref:GDSL-type esterase/lipase family protein n=1 Tax=Saccharothrix sp. Mg75 TaxID=3445357 RepID=UPI003EEB6652